MRKVLLGCVVTSLLVGCGSSQSSTTPTPPRANGGGENSSSPGGGAASNPAVGGSTEIVGGSSGATGGSASSSGGTSSGGASSGGSDFGGGALGTAPSAASAQGTGYGDAGPITVAPGILTAGIWDDGLNYPFFTQYRAANLQIPGDPGFTTAEYDAAHTEFAQRGQHTIVDAALVLDTTGSMGDEIQYLTAEFANISSAIAAAFPSADQRWALVVYRDRPDTDPGDAYIVKSFDFTGDLQTFGSTVGAQTAANGGDTPEAPELGLGQLPQLSWRSDPSVAKVAFWVADAPHHAQYASTMKQSIVNAHSAGIHLYPVSASGTDDLLELTMRSAALITGGRYLFLTDDSGVGDPHKKPEIPCYYVTHLGKALVRSISMELSGTYAGPDAQDVIRVSGSPTSSGSCALDDDGGTVQIF
jgi:hypothetical protein